MKRVSIFSLLLLSMFLASCTTYQYTARQTEINNRQMDTKVQRAAIQVDYDRQVTATSNYQITRRDAINEAEFMCIRDEKIDVVVDPIYRIEFNPFKFKKNYRATIIGFAGKYQEKETLLDESKKYTIEDIEKYKLLYDPSFLPYFYQQPTPAGGDVYNYYIKSGAGAGYAPAAPAKSPAINKTAPSIMLKNQPAAPKPIKHYSSEDLRKAKKLRDGGISAIVCGAAVCLAVGLPVFATVGNWGYTEHSSYSVEKRRVDGTISGSVLMAVGAASFIAGVPMTTVGAVRYNKGKKTQYMDITLNSGSNGLGLALNF